jgi:HEAT repeat protein
VKLAEVCVDLQVRLLELIAELNFSVVAFVSGSDHLQQILVWDVVLQLLGDEDSRVRTAAALSLQKCI